jgi:type II secretory pathway pseudopilin PulG
VAFVETTAAPRAAQALAGLTQFALSAGASKTEGRVALRAWTHGDVRCSSLVFPGLPVPLEVSFAASADALWVAASRSALQAALDQTQSERSLLDRGLPPEATQESVSFGFFDTAHFLERGYGSASLLAAGLANAVRSPRDPAREPGQVLPPLASLSQDVQPAVSWSRIEGPDLVSRATFERSFAAHGTALAGTPFATSYSGLVGLGMVSSIAIPKLMTARNSANEAAAIATLRSIASAQAQFQAVGIVDSDGDGVGEHGFFGELAGARPVRVGRQGRSAWDPSGEALEPPVLSPAFAALADDGTGAVCVQRSGYVFQMWLPASTTDGGPEGCAEPAAWPPRDASRVDPELAERFWCCYAWPASPGSTGNRVFFIDQEGDLLVCDGAGEYGGLFAQGGVQPAFDAAFNAGGGVAVDGLVWRPLE